MYVPTTVVRVARSVLPVTFSGLVLLLAAAALPDLAGLGLLAVVTTSALAVRCGVGEGLACRVLTGSRPPTAVEDAILAGATTLACRAGLGPPVVQLRVQPRNLGLVPYAWGTGVVVVPGGLVVALREGRVGPAEAAAGLCHASATCRAGLATQHGVAHAVVPAVEPRGRLPRRSWPGREGVSAAVAGLALPARRGIHRRGPAQQRRPPGNGRRRCWDRRGDLRATGPGPVVRRAGGRDRGS